MSLSNPDCARAIKTQSIVSLPAHCELDCDQLNYALVYFPSSAVRDLLANDLRLVAKHEERRSLKSYIQGIC